MARPPPAALVGWPRSGPAAGGPAGGFERAGREPPQANPKSGGKPSTTSAAQAAYTGR